MPFSQFGIELRGQAQRWMTEACECCQRQFTGALRNTVFDVIILLAEHDMKLWPCIRSLRGRGVARRNGFWLMDGFTVGTGRFIEVAADGTKSVSYFLKSIDRHQVMTMSHACRCNPTFH